MSTLLVVALASAGLAWWVNGDPARYESNRVATLDTLDDSVEAIGGPPTDWAIIHVDWVADNEYFVEQASKRFPDADVRSITIGEYQTLGGVLREGFASDELQTVLVISRLPLDARILPQIPADQPRRTVDPNAVLIGVGA